MTQALNTDSRLPGFEPEHRELFALFRQAGWRPMHPSPAIAAADYALANQHFFMNDPGQDFWLALGGLTIAAADDLGATQLRFSTDQQLPHLTNCGGFHIDVHRILGNNDQPPPQDGFPVAEVNGSILFVRNDFTAALIDHSLCGFFRAPSPFIILDWVLLRKHSPLLEHHAVHPGARIADLLDDRGDWAASR